MGTSIKLFLLTILCSTFLIKCVYSQGYRSYKHRDVNQYEIRNGKYRIIPTTTPPPSLIETFFPWTGNAYNSVRTPEEDAAILSSLMDPDPSTGSSNDGFMSWLSMPTIPSLPGFGSTSSGPSNEAPSANSPMRPNYPPSMPGPMNFHNTNMLGSHSQIEPIFSPPPGEENSLGLFPAPASQQQQPLSIQYPPAPASQPQSMSQQQPLSAQYPPAPTSQQQPLSAQYPPSPQNYNIPHEIRNNVNPTFQFHQQVKDSIPIPSPSLQGLGQPMFPYPYSAGGSLDFGKGTFEKSPSILATLSNYFSFGMRSDLEGQLSIDDENVMQPRSMDGNEEYETEDSVDGYGHDAEGKETSTDNELAPSSSATPPSPDGKAFPCPKSGIWRWNGEVCIAVGPVPIWACKPNDLIVSGKIAICRNKIYFSPKVINNNIIGKRANSN